MQNYINLSVKVDAIKAALITASKKDTRYYLQAVHIETGSFGAKLITTNGHCMSVHLIDDKPEIESYITIPREVFDSMKTKFKEISISYPIEKTENQREVLIQHESKITVLEIDAKYPEYRRVIPDYKNMPQALAYFDPEYLLDAAKQMKILGEGKLKTIFQAGEKLAYISARIDFMIFIMPLRVENVKRSEYCMEFVKA